MNPATDINTRRPQMTTAGQAALNEARAKAAIAELPDLFGKLGKQNQAVHRAIKEQTAVTENVLRTLTNERDWTERIHERLDAIAIEGRVTNILLAELVAVNKSVIPEPVGDSSESIRSDAYNRVMNGE